MKGKDLTKWLLVDAVAMVPPRLDGETEDEYFNRMDEIMRQIYLSDLVKEAQAKKE